MSSKALNVAVRHISLSTWFRPRRAKGLLVRAGKKSWMTSFK